MVNSTLFNLMIDVPDSLPPDMREILLGKGGMNRLEKMFIPRIINNDPDLTILELIHSYLNEDAMTRLCNALILNSTITSLDLSRCSIGGCGVSRICETMKLNFSLFSLKLQYNVINDIGATSLASALEIIPR